MNAWRSIERGLLEDFQVQLSPPLLQSGTKSVSFREVTVSNGTKEVVQMKIVHTNMKFLPKERSQPNLRGKAVEEDLHQELNHPKARGRRNASSGSVDVVTEETTASSYIKDQQVTLDKLPQPDHRLVVRRVTRNHLGALAGSLPVVQERKARVTPDPRRERREPSHLAGLLLQLFAWSPPC